MSQSRSSPQPGQFGNTANAAQIIDGEDGIRTVLAALEDDGCRDILGATAETALSASELSDRCDLPLSTAYRKLDLLTEAGLLEERTRIRTSGAHTSEYVLAVDDVLVSMSDGRLEIELS